MQKKRRKYLRRLLAQTLSIAMLLTFVQFPVSAQTETAEAMSLSQVVDALSGLIDKENAFDYLGGVYLGWRTTGGPWQNYVINDMLVGELERAGYTDAGAFYTPGDGDVEDKSSDISDDFVWVQHDASSGSVWAPVYARMEITGIENAAPEQLDEIKSVVDVESYGYDPTSAIYQEHYKSLYELTPADDGTDAFVAAMTGWINETNTEGGRVNVENGLEAELNRRAHLATNSCFTTDTADIINPADAADEAVGKTGKLVYVGTVSGRSPDFICSAYAGPLSELSGCVLLSDSNNRTAFSLAQSVGAVGVMSKASLSSYNNPDFVDELGNPTGEKMYTDSARFAGGASLTSTIAATAAGTPVVEFNISIDQYHALQEALGLGEVTMNVAAVGTTYPMSNTAPTSTAAEEGQTSHAAAQGQLTAIAEIKGAVYPEERVLLMAHVQEPGSNDNATGVALNLELAVALKEAIEAGTLPRPDRTITFLWGDEMSFSSLYLNAHTALKDGIVCTIDLDMVGEDPEKCGGPMRIEKCPDPSAYYNYTLDTLPGEGEYSDPDNFVRLPDSHTLWGAGDPESCDIGGNYINDLYMAAANLAAAKVAETDGYDFQVDVCPYEGGSDHSVMLEADVPAVLTWHFTDYTYHTTIDTLAMSSADEMRSVGITSLAAAYFSACAGEEEVREMMETMYQAAYQRLMVTERENTRNHYLWTLKNQKDTEAAYENEQEVLNAWADWYREAVASCGGYFGGFDGYDGLLAAYYGKIEALRAAALEYAGNVFMGAFIADDAAMIVNSPVISLADHQSFTAMLSFRPTGIAAEWDEEAWAVWAQSIDWTLTRTDEEYLMDRDLYPYYYPGDALENWKCWSTGASAKDYFTLGEVRTVLEDGLVTVTLPFSTNYFFGSANTSSVNRNILGGFIGPYTLAACDGDRQVASAPMYVNTYKGYCRNDDIFATLTDIQAAAAAKGRYMQIVDYGDSEGGRDQYYVLFSDEEASVGAFREMNSRAVTDPAALQAEIQAGTLTDYRVPFMLNNVHSDENPGADAQLWLLRQLATADTISYNTLTGFKDTSVDVTGLFAPAITGIEGFTGLGSQKFTGENARGGWNNNTGANDAAELYDISGGITYTVDDLLDNLILICAVTENPDGRAQNTRRNANGFDLNRDAANQTQSETQNISKVINEWNPVVFAEFHGYMSEFLVEPCTPPHEPNLEYDLLVENFLLGAEAFGKAALGTMSAARNYETKFWSYYTPLRDDYDPESMVWSAWDDLCTNYTPSYAMLNCGALGYTIETPYCTEAAGDLLVCGTYGLLQYVMQNKEDIYLNQLEFFRRGIQNIDAQTEMDEWYVDVHNNELDEGTWRVRYEENENYFPEYYVIPVDAGSQRDPADAYTMGQYLIDNGVRIARLTADTEVGDTVFKAGSLVVDMHQAKRNYANAVLWRGADASASGFPDLYSESVSNFPEMRGFTCVPVAAVGALEGKTAELTEIVGKSQFSGTSGKIVIVENNGNEAVRAVNALLDAGRAVGLITAGEHTGDFVMSYSVFSGVQSKYTLVATGVGTMPEAYQIVRPKIYLTGRYPLFANYKVTEGYYAEWFSEGYGFADYYNVQNNGTSAYDKMAFGSQLGFTIVDDPAEADVILGSVALTSSRNPDPAALAAVQAGTPYIAMGSSPLSYIKTALLGGDSFDYSSLGMEALHSVVYPDESIITSTYVSDEDFIAYSYNCTVLTAYPEDAVVLIRAAEEDSLIAGCCLNEDGEMMDGKVEAIAVTQDGMDLTIFANSIVNRAHQQDDYRYVTNTIYSKCLASTRMTITVNTGSSTPSAPADPFIDIAGHWAHDDIVAATEKGVFVVGTDKKFYPDASATRAEFVLALWRMSGKPAAEDASPFADIASNAEYRAAVDWAYEAGITKGRTETAFIPSTTIPREEMVTMLYRYALYMQRDTAQAGDISAFPDGEAVRPWAREAMAWAVGTGMIRGRTDGRIDPLGLTTHGELAAMLVRYGL